MSDNGLNEDRPAAADSDTTIARNSASCGRRRSPTISIRGIASPFVAAIEAASPLLLDTNHRRSIHHYRGKVVVGVGGERIMGDAVRRGGQMGPAFVSLMRNLLFPRASCPHGASDPGQLPRLVEAVVPGFDRYIA